MSPVGLGRVKTLWRKHRRFAISARWPCAVIFLDWRLFRSGGAPEADCSRLGWLCNSRRSLSPATPPPSRAGRWDATSFKVEPLSGLETPYGTLMAQGCTGDRPAIRRPQTERGQNRVETVRGRQSRA